MNAALCSAAASRPSWAGGASGWSRGCLVVVLPATFVHGPLGWLPYLLVRTGPAGELTLPPFTPVPERLWRLAPYRCVD